MALVQNIPFFPEGYYPKLLERSYNKEPNTIALYPNSGPESNFQDQINAKSTFTAESRNILADELIRQYGELATGKVLENIQSLRSNHTFTVTTGQQIHLMLGPMYVVYKALTVINLAKSLQVKFPENNFVPVFWMATEDHDFEEINHFRLFGKDFRWEAPSGGPVGRLSTKGISELILEAEKAFPNDPKVGAAMQIFHQAYQRFDNLADSTRFLLHHFFGSDGLVVLDPDSEALKRAFIPGMQKDLREGNLENLVVDRTTAMEDMGLETAIHGRSPNLFLLENGVRERLDRQGSGFKLKQSGKEFSPAELEKLLLENPGLFSPNVSLRPVYQEVILPNLAYIGGPGEYTYWYQLQPLFAAFGLPAPILLARFSLVLADAKAKIWLDENGWRLEQLFQSEDGLKNDFLNLLRETNPFSEWATRLQSTQEEVNTFLYKLHHPDLKILKKAGEDYLKALKVVNEGYDNELINNKLNAQIWQKLTRIKQRFFDAAAPQERTLFFMEPYIQNQQFLNELALPDGLEKWPLSFAWR
jgi:bacillithiol biosynthesis cysteine-adding enzyme BshC